MLMAILEETDGEKARRQYLKLFGLDDINDEEVHDLLADRLFDAIMRDELTVEIERELAQRALLLIKNGMKRPRGGQPRDRRRARRLATLVRIARQIKAELLAGGVSATDAHAQAAAEAAKEGKKHGLDYTASYLARAMERRVERLR